MNKYLIALLAAVALLLAACGDDEEGADGDTTTTVAAADASEETDDADGDTSDDSAAADDAGTDDDTGVDDSAGDSTDTAMSDSGDDEDGAMADSTDDTDEDTEDFGADAEVGDFISSFFAQTGSEVTPEILDCLADRDIDAGLSMLEATEEELNLAGLGLFACAPSELAPAISFDITPPDGTDTADVECVVTETFRYVGTLPTDEALAALDSADIPDEIREGIRPIAEDVCGLDTDVVEEILSATS